MKIARCKLVSISTLSQSRKHNEPKLNDKEKPDDYEKRTWRHKCHTNEKGEVIITPIAFKFSIDQAAKMLRMRIPGKGNSEYTKHFKSGIIVTTEVVIAKSRDDLVPGTFLMSVKGVRGNGGGSKVERILPQVPKWSGVVDYYVIDETITQDVFEKHLRESGNLVGIGQFRPENGGYCGRFKVESIEWLDG
jgi:hypothetical protein